MHLHPSLPWPPKLLTELTGNEFHPAVDFVVWLIWDRMRAKPPMVFWTEREKVSI